MAETVHEKMPFTTTIEKLEADGFSCDLIGKVDPAKTCTKTRQSLLPYTCVERVNVKPSADARGGSAIEVRPIVCAGL